MTRLPKKSDMAPLNRACRSALEAMMRDRNMRIFLWCLVAEETRCLTPFAQNLSARDIGLRLLETMKDVSLKGAHQAEADYMQKCDEDAAWRTRQPPADESENPMEEM